MKNFRLLLRLLNHSDRLKLCGLFVLMFIGGLLEMAGIGLIFPYIAIIGNPELIHQYNIISQVYVLLGFSNDQAFQIFLSISLLFVFLFKNIFNVWVHALQHKFSFKKQVDVSKGQLDFYINRPYHHFLSTNSSRIIHNLTQAIPSVFNGLMLSYTLMISEALVVMCIMTVIIYIQPVTAIVSMAVLGSATLVFFFFFKKRIFRYGEIQNMEHTAIFQHINQGIGGIKEIKVLGCGNFFVKRFEESASRYVHAMRRFQFVNQLPRAYLEILLIGGMISIILMILIQGSTLQTVIPLLAVYAAAAVRILPSINKIINYINTIGFNNHALQIVAEEMNATDEPGPEEETNGAEALEPIFTKELKILDVSFRYAKQNDPVLNGIYLSLKKGESVALIGHSGSGKSTLVDLILGLLKPDTGVISSDGFDIHKNSIAWQRHVGYIPQQIYLTDDTVARNIALGLPDSMIDQKRLDEVLRMAELEEVVAGMPDGVNTLIGEGGIRLSGGQRQRIGIARAIYHDPDILIMDEATSALDNVTENNVIDSIRKLGSQKTIIMIAHRLTTVRYCNFLYLMENGRIVDSGTYKEIEERHPDFINPGSRRSGAHVASITG